MNRVDKELNKIVLDTVNELLTAGVEDYERIRLTLLSRASNDDKIHDYICRLIAFTDKHRPPMIPMKGGAVV